MHRGFILTGRLQSVVTGRCVGIGAYLVRLGNRVIQVDGQPIILTGAPALNKLLGRDVYSPSRLCLLTIVWLTLCSLFACLSGRYHSNNQLGGVRIMYRPPARDT